jgi:sirohydrochlorin ferrochelatase
MSRPVLLAVAHGSTDPAAAETVTLIGRQVAALAPGLDVRTAFLQHGGPTLGSALADAGSDVVIVPLLLSTGYHLTSDIADAAAREGARVAAQLGPDPLLTEALAGRLAEAGVPPGTPVVLAAAGSADPAAAAQVRRQAALLAARLGAPVRAAFASGGEPPVGGAVAALRRATRRPVAVAAYLLCPGRFHDQLTDTGTWITAPLGGHPAVARLVLDRYQAARQELAAGAR